MRKIDMLKNQTREANIVGSFMTSRDEDFDQELSGILESFNGSYELDPIRDVGTILSNSTYREEYKSRLLDDVMESSFSDPYFDLHGAKLEQMFENVAEDIVTESQSGPMQPIVGLTLPILKKNYLECNSKDVVMNEVADSPIIKRTFERKFLKDRDGNKHYVPDVFYDKSYQTIMNKAKGKPISAKFYPDADAGLPLQNLNILTESGGTIQTRDTLDYDFHIKAIKLMVGAEEVVLDNLFIQPEMSTGGTLSHQFVAKNAAGTEKVEGLLSGKVDSYNGTVTLMSSVPVKSVQFGGHLSNENNTEVVELDRERENMTWKIPTGAHLNTGYTVDQIKDMKALFDWELVPELVADMTEILVQYKDSETFDHLEKSFDKWKNQKDLPFGFKSFTEQYKFSAKQTTTTIVLTPQWMEQIRYFINRQLDKLANKIKTKDIMFVIYANPELVTLIQDDVRWVIDEGTKVGGIQLDYRFGVMNKTKKRVHVVSSMKVDPEIGFRIVAYPMSEEVMTFKSWDYSLNIVNDYRNAATPLTRNVTAMQRFLNAELLPVQGEFKITDADFGRVTN